MAKAIWTSLARRDLKAIGHYIGQQEHRPSAAVKILREIHAKCDSYSQAASRGSLMGEVASELGDNCRVFSYQRWVIVFQHLENGIEVLRVFDASRDYPRLFSKS